MNSMQRVKAAMTGQPFDRRPFSAVLSMYGARYTGASLTDHYHDAGIYVEGQDAVRSELEPDILFAPFCMVLFAEAFGGKAKYLAKQAPNLVQPGVNGSGEVGEMPDIESHPRLVYLRESTRRMAERFRDEVPVAAVSLGPLDLPAMMMGLDAWLQTFLFDRDATARMLDLTVPFCVDLANALLADGAGCVVFPTVFMNSAVLPESLAEERALPIFHEILPMINGPVILHHGGAPFQQIAPMCANLPENLAGIVIDHTDDPCACQAAIGPGRTVFGGIDGPTLGKRSPEEIRILCTERLTDAATDPRYILTTSGPDVPMETPPENIRAMAETIHAFYA